MSDFRKQMHVAYKLKLAEIIDRFLSDCAEDGEKAFEPSTDEYISKWIDRNCLPMGDFSMQDAIKEMEEWQKD